MHVENFMESSDLLRLLAKQRARWEDNINIDLKKNRMAGCGLDYSGSRGH